MIKNPIIRGIIAILFGCIALFLAFKSSNAPKLKRSDLVQISGTLKNDIHVFNKRKNRNSLSLHLKEYPEYYFSIDPPFYYKTKHEALRSEKKAGMPINFFIATSDAQKLKQEPSFNNNIKIVELPNYLSFSDYEATSKSSQGWGRWIWGIFGLILFFFAFKSFTSVKKT